MGIFLKFSEHLLKTASSSDAAPVLLFFAPLTFDKFRILVCLMCCNPQSKNFLLTIFPVAITLFRVVCCKNISCGVPLRE